MRYFDYQSVAREAGISAEDLERLCSLIRQEFPGDDMLFELHVMRACKIIKDGPYTMEQVVADLAPAAVTGTGGM
jgi:hypothetical protein